MKFFVVVFPKLPATAIIFRALCLFTLSAEFFITLCFAMAKNGVETIFAISTKNGIAITKRMVNRKSNKRFALSKIRSELKATSQKSIAKKKMILVRVV